MQRSYNTYMFQSFTAYIEMLFENLCKKKEEKTSGTGDSLLTMLSTASKYAYVIEEFIKQTLLWCFVHAAISK